MTWLYLLRKRVRCYGKLRREFPGWSVRRCWFEAGEVQRWSLMIMAEIAASSVPPTWDFLPAADGVEVVA